MSKDLDSLLNSVAFKDLMMLDYFFTRVIPLKLNMVQSHSKIKAKLQETKNKRRLTRVERRFSREQAEYYKNHYKDAIKCEICSSPVVTYSLNDPKDPRTAIDDKSVNRVDICLLESCMYEKFYKVN